MSLMGTRIYEHFAALLCNNEDHRKADEHGICHCGTLKTHYGSRTFKCSFPSCSFSRRGFATYKARDVHIKCENHSRPWKCSIQGCQFATIGFASRGDAHSHWQKRHRISNPDPARSTKARFSDELQVLLFEHVKASNIDDLQRLAPQIAANEEVVSPAILLAATKGSLPMVEILTDWSTCWPEDTAFYKAVMKGENPDLLLWFLDKLLCARGGKYDNYGWLAGEAVASSSPDMYAAWEDFLLDPDRGLKIAYPCFSGDPDALLNNGVEPDMEKEVEIHGRFFYDHSSMKQHHERSILFSNSAFGAAKKNAIFEARLVQTWHKLINIVLGGRPLDKRFLGWALVCLARSSNQSITLGKELLGLGAPIDFPRGAGSNLSKSEAEKIRSCVEVYKEKEGFDRRYRQKRQKGMTAVQCAARGTSEQAAHFVRFLLEQGADPDYGWADTKPATEPGVALMQKWLGETWEELVKRTAGARLEKEQVLRLQYGEECNDREEADSSGKEVAQSKQRVRPSSQRAGGDIKRQKLV